MTPVRESTAREIAARDREGQALAEDADFTAWLAALQASEAWAAGVALAADAQRVAEAGG